MSRFRNPLLRRFTETFSGIRNFSRKGGSSSRKTSGDRRRKPRRLVLDTLEERRLLSLTAADVEESLVTDNLGWAYSRPDSVESLGAEDTVIPYGSYAYSDERVEGTDGLYYPKYIVVPGTAVSQSDRSMAGARDNDFAMTWTQADTIQQASLDGNGKLTIDQETGLPQYEAILDPTTGYALMDTNVYAKYFTDEVQQVTFSQAVLNGTEATAYDPADCATVTFHYGGNEIQKLTISTATVPTNTDNNGDSDNAAVLQYGDAVTGQITLAFDVNGNGFIENREQTTILYNELNFDNADLTQRPEYIIQQQLRLMGGSLSDVRVQAVTAREFLIHFGDASGGVVQPSIQVVPETTAFDSGFLAWATVAKYNEPITVTANVYPGDAEKTAAEIQKAFKEQTQSDHEMAPWYGSITNSQFLLSQSGVLPTSRYADANVSVKVVTEGVPDGHIGFELTFLGADQSKNVPEIEVVGMTLVDGTVLNKADLNSGTISVGGGMQTSYTVVTVKETSDVFRVNSADPVDELTLAPRPLNQYDAQVAMDADGDFVIVWTGDSTVTGSFTDIYARQFSPTTLITYEVGDDGAYVQFEDTVDGKSVSEPTRSQQVTDHGRLLSSTDSTQLLNVEAEREEFVVNSTLTLVQNCPTIGMDDAGNFVIGWQTLAQDQSWFETMSIQRFDSNAKRTGGEMQIEPDTASYIGYGTVSMSRDGYIAVAWQTVNVNIMPAPGDNGDLSASNLKYTHLRMMDANGLWIADTVDLLADGGASIHACTYGRVAMEWDSNSTLTVALAWCERVPNSDPTVHDNIITSLGSGDMNVYFWQYDSAANNLAAGLTHVNNASSEQGWGTVTIGGWQTGASVAVDADGDLFISFEGRGRDISGEVNFLNGATYFAEEIAALRAAGGITNLTIADYLEGLNDSALDVDLIIRDLSAIIYADVTDQILSEADRQAEMILRAMGDSEWAQIRDDRVTELMGLVAAPTRDPTLGTRPELEEYPYYDFLTDDQPEGDMLWDQVTLEAYRVDVYTRLVEGTWVDENGELVQMTPAEANEALKMYDEDGYPLAADPLVMVIWARVDADHYADDNANPIRKRYGEIYEAEREQLWTNREDFIEFLITIAFNQEFGLWRNRHVVADMGLYRADGAAVTVDGNAAPYYDFWNAVDNPDGEVLWSQNRLNAYRQEVYWKLYSGTFEGKYDDGTAADFSGLAYSPWACRAALGTIDEDGNWVGDADPRILVEYARLEGNAYAFANEAQIREIAAAAVMAEQTLLIEFEAQQVADRWLRETYGVAGIADPLVAQATAIMESKLTLLRGEAYGANFSTWDASVNANGTNSFTVTSSDNVANARHDGNNATAYIGIPLDAGQGSFYINVAGDQILITPVFLPTDPPTLDAAGTYQSILDTLSEYGASVNWITGTTPDTFYVDTYWDFSDIWSSMRWVSGENDDGEEYVALWEVRNAIYEITFNGTYHDVSGMISCSQNPDDPLLTASDPEQDRLPDTHQLYTADPGRPQTGVSLISDAEGNIVMTWTETNGPTAIANSDSMKHLVATISSPYYYDNHPNHSGYIDPTADVYMSPYSGGYASDDGLVYTYTIGYTQPTFGSDARIWFRRFNEVNSNNELNDTAGPTVTDVTYGSSVASDEPSDSVSAWTSLNAGVGGTAMEDEETFIRELNGTWTFDNEDGTTHDEPVTVLVISFDEELATSGSGSVLNPSNWTLMKDGTNCNQAIEQIYFGLNKSSELAYRFESVTGLNNLSRTGANRWEAVIILNGADSPDLDYSYLKAGVYNLTAKASITDVSGNRLNRSGYLPNGQAWTQSFQIIGWNGEQAVETLTNESATLEERSTTPIASNANGDYAVVYRTLTEEGASLGIELDLYNKIAWGNQEEDEDLAPDRQPITDTGAVTIYGEVDYTRLHLVVTDNETACNASVAMDGDGDFIVVWSQNDSVTNAKSDWNVYAKKYDFQGRVIREAFRVNQTVAYDQTNPSVAVDAEGSFVVVWQSNNQDGSGWGVYMQRYTPNCIQIGGENATQTLTFDTENFVAGEQFRLQYGTKSDSPRTVAITMINLDEATRTQKQAFCDTVCDALEALLFDEDEGIYLDVNVTMDSSGALVITFQGLCGCQTVKKLVPLTVAGSREYDITVTQSKSGSPSERQVNSTTAGDQIHPAVDMNENGEIVVSWTSYGMGSSNHVDANGVPESTDTMSESDICARRFISNETYLASLEASYAVADSGAEPLVVTSDDYNLHIAYPGSGSDGVVKIMNNALGGYGTGALLWDGMHILTAAHVVTGADEMTPANANDLYVYFDMPDGTVTVQVTEVYIPDEYQLTGFNQAYGGGHDIAVLTLATAAPTDAERYDIYRDSDEIGQDFKFYGYGQYGLGATGEITSDQYKRYGENTFESLGTENLDLAEDLLVFDSDDGTQEHNALAHMGITSTTGLGRTREASTAHGDSGGPSIIDGKIAAVTSGGYPDSPVDYDDEFNCSWGEISYNTRVSVYADWIDSAVNGELSTNNAGYSEFIVNSFTAGDQKWSSVGVAPDGSFVVTWTGVNEEPLGDGAGIYAEGYLGNCVFMKRYDANGAEVVMEASVTDADGAVTVGYVSGDVYVNTTVENDQQQSRISMDGVGNFVIVWESWQDRKDESRWQEANTAVSWGIYAQQYASTASLTTSASTTVDPTDPTVVIPATATVVSDLSGRLGSEFRVGQTIDGDQRYPGVAMDREGDFVVTWSGAGKGSEQGVYWSHYIVPVDEVGPIVTEVLALREGVDSDGKPVRVVSAIPEGAVLESGPDHLGVIFGEDMVGAGEFASAVNESVTNLDNWDLTCDGKSVKSLIDKVIVYDVSSIYEEGLMAEEDGKYEIVITFAERPVTSSDRSDVVITREEVVTHDDGSTEKVRYTRDLPEGTYTLTLKKTVEDIFGNPLDGNRDGINGDAFVRTFSVGEPGSSGGTGGATDIDDPDANPQTPDTPISASILGQTDPVVACDKNGNYVLVWVEYQPTDPTVDITDPDLDTTDMEMNANIMARRYNSSGQAIGEAWLVNNLTGFFAQDQIHPDISMNTNGEFAIVWDGWSSTDTDGGICMRAYSATGVPQGNIVQVNVTKMGYQENPSVAMGEDGLIVVTWCGPSYKLSTVGSITTVAIVTHRSEVYMAVFKPSSESTDAKKTPVRVTTTKSVEEVTTLRVNEDTAKDNHQTNPSVAISESNEVAVVWQSSYQDGSGAGVYGRWFQASVTGIDAVTSEKLISETTTNDQTCPDIEMSNDGNAVVAWQSAQNASTTGTDIYFRQFGPGGVPISHEARVNEAVDDYGMNHLLNNQFDAWVTVARGTGDFSISWTSTGQETYWGGRNSEGVYGRLYKKDGTPMASSVKNNEYGVYRLNNWVEGDQNSSSIALSNNGLLIGVWHGPETQYNTIGDTEDTTYGTDVVYARIMSVSEMSPASSSSETAASQVESVIYWYRDGSSGYVNGEVAVDSTVYQIAGTSGDDTIVVTTAANLADWIVTVNGAKMTIPTGTTALEIAKSGGNDTLRIVNPDGTATTATLGVTQGTLSRNDETILTWSGMKAAYYDGAAADTVTLEGTSGVDTVTMDTFGTIVLAASGGAVTVSGATGSVAVNGLGGKDVLSLEGTSSTDKIVASSALVTMTTTGSAAVRSFAGFTDVTLSGAGQDTLELTGSDGVDQFSATPTGATLVSGVSTIRSSGFLRTTFAGGVGMDRVNLLGSAQRDTLSSTTTNSSSVVTFATGSVSYTISGAEVVYADLGAGDDVANLRHTGSRNGLLVGRESETTWKVGDLDLTVVGATRLAVLGTANDSATLYDSMGNDVLTSRPGQVKFSRSSSVHKLTGFGNVSVQAVAGGYDSATLVGSTGDDVFTSTPESATMVSSGYTVKAAGFGKVVAQAVAGGNDVATLSDSTRYTTTDTLTVTPTSVTLSSGSRQSVTARSFGTVSAKSNSGSDVATFTTSTGDDTFTYTESTNAAALTGVYLGTHYGVTATGYSTVKATSKSGTDAAIFELSNEENFSVSGKVATALTESVSVTATGFATNKVTKPTAVAAADAAFADLLDE